MKLKHFVGKKYYAFILVLCMGVALLSPFSCEKVHAEGITLTLTDVSVKEQTAIQRCVDEINEAIHKDEDIIVSNVGAYVEDTEIWKYLSFEAHEYDRPDDPNEGGDDNTDGDLPPEDPYISPQGVKGVFTMYKGDQQTFTLQNVENPSAAKWTSSNKEVLSIKADGTANAKKKGTVTVTCTTPDGEKLQRKVSIIERGKSKEEGNSSMVDSIKKECTLSPSVDTELDAVGIAAGGSKQFTLKKSGKAIEKKYLTWSLSAAGKKIASLSKSGKLTVKKKAKQKKTGTVSVIYKYNKSTKIKFSRKFIVINPNAKDVELPKTKKTSAKSATSVTPIQSSNMYKGEYATTPNNALSTVHAETYIAWDLSIDTATYSYLETEEKHKVMEIALGKVNNSQISKINKNRIYNFISSSDDVTASLVRQLSEDVRADYFTAFAWFRPFSGVFGWILGLFVLFIFAFLGLTIVIDIAFITIPAFQMAMINAGEKKDGVMHPKLASVEAYTATQEAVKGAKFKDPLSIYFKLKLKQFLVMGVCLLYLVSGSIYTVISSIIDLFSGLLP